MATTTKKDDELRQCRWKCRDREGNFRMLPPGREFDICSTCAAAVARLSKKTSGEANLYLQTQEVRLERALMVKQGGKTKEGKLDPKNYLGQLKLKRQKAGVKVVYGK